MDLSLLGGWVDRPDAVEAVLAEMPRPVFASAAGDISGSGSGKTTLLYKAWKDVNGGSYVPYVAQEIGDCVSHGWGHGVDLLEAVRIAIQKTNEEFKQTATEAVYGMARVDIGGGSLWGDGAVGAWAAKAVTTIGTVSRDVVGPYSGQRAKSWGRSGVPADIKAKAADHKVKTTSLVSSWEELEDALFNGYPVPVCSNQGFTMTRDANGFCRPKGTWGHCMLIVGVRNDTTPGACIFQSWGPNNPSGPLSLDQPDNSFWVDKDTVVRMLGARDTFAMSGFDGYPGQKLPDHFVFDNHGLAG